MTRVDALSEGPYGRTSFEFDTIDADDTDAFDEQIGQLFQEKQTKPFALLRVMTTAAGFRDFSVDVLEPGDWFFLDIEPNGSRPGLMTGVIKRGILTPMWSGPRGRTG